jgi:transmembrane sensor
LIIGAVFSGFFFISHYTTDTRQLTYYRKSAHKFAMGNKNAEKLLRAYLQGTTTPEQEALLESWYLETAQAQSAMPGDPDYPAIEARILQPLRAEQMTPTKIPCHPDPIIPTATKSPIRLWRIAAAAVVIILSVASLYIPRKIATPTVAQTQPPKNDLLPAATRAHLTLLDGQTITLDSSHNGPLAKQGVSTISENAGQLTYSSIQPDRSVGPQATAYNTLTTSPGEHYSLLLADGTKVWLNAASSITYPVAFTGSERKVRITGEVYFEIIHNAKQPFKIFVKNQLVEDIGTHLNINAYDDEAAINTTLLEGSIKISKGSASTILSPGQEAALRPGANAFELKNADADKAIAWRNGYFYFDRADIKTVMRELARWYNVQLVYQGAPPKRTFKGKVYRNINASEALRILTYFGAHFQIEGKTITVSS